MGIIQRAIGLIVFGIAILGAALLAASVAMSGPPMGRDPSRTLVLGGWDILYDVQLPPAKTLLAAVGLALLFAAGVALVERQITGKSRRSDVGEELPLAPKVVMRQTLGVYAGPVTVTVLVPAHNEAACIDATLRALLAQSHRPERVVVVADNCTDDTEAIAHAVGVDVFRSVANTKKKAGALNQALAELLPTQRDNDVLMIMDADTTLDQGFLEAAVRRFTDDRAVMAVGGLFYGEEGKGLIGQFQRNEYTRYSRDLRRRRGRVYVLTGTASIFRPRALRAAADSRGRLLPGRHGDVYDTAALTEDNELTLALKNLGAILVSPAPCTVVTEVMPTWQALWAQRLRWQRGAVENLGAYGLRPQTFRYWAQQLGIGYGVIALAGYLLLILLMALSLDAWVWFPFWLLLGTIFVVERVVTVWRGGWRARALAATLFPELVYAMFLNVVYLKGILDIARGQQASWKHVVTTDGRARTVNE